MAENKKDRKGGEQYSTGVNPKQVVNNPDYQSEGGNKDLNNIHQQGHGMDVNTGKSINGPDGKARKADQQDNKAKHNFDDNQNHPNMEKKQSRDNEYQDGARPQGFRDGHPDKTNVKNTSGTEEMQGQQQGGNHGGGNAALKRQGNQSNENKSITQQRDVDGDAPHGSKGKKR